MILGSVFQRVKTIGPSEVRAIIKEKSADDYSLLDVRQPSEYEQAHLPGATLIPLAQLQSDVHAVPPNRMTIVYCRSGNRSRSAVGMLNGAGMEDVYNMEGGILAYNGIVAAGPPEAGVFCFPENMSPQQLIAMAWYIEEGSRHFVDTIQAMSRDNDVIASLSSLANHKRDHQATLGRLYEKISGQRLNDRFPECVLDKPPEMVMSGCVSVPDAVNWSKDKDIADILDLMMGLEANTFDLYLKLGRAVTSKRARSVFMELSEEQARHLDQLASVFEKKI